MTINVQKANWKSFACDAAAFFQPEDKKWIADSLGYYDKGSALQATASSLIAAGDMTGKKDEAIVLYPSNKEAAPKRIILIGLGKPDATTLETVRRSAAKAAKKAVALKSKTLAIYLPRVKGQNGGAIAAAAVEGILLGLYKFDKFFKKDEPAIPLETVTILSDSGEIFGSSLADVRKSVARAEVICAATIFARDMENEPSNNKYPEIMGKWAQQVAKETSGVKVTLFGPSELKKHNMIGIIAVNQGSAKEGRFIIMEYFNARSKNAKPIVIVGKGITFDTGGISLKPGAGMGDMIGDMSGGAAVIATMKAVAALGLKVNVVGLVASAENMPSGTATRPGDVITYPNGISAEIDNTDAEGRLVLADVLSYARRFDPAVVVDAATLTGACVVALGHTATGIFCTDEALISEIVAAGKRAGEPGWSLPMWDEYRELIKSDVADIKNSGGRAAGAVSAAMFLKEFTESYPWIHLDIAGTAYSDADLGSMPKGPTGVPTGTFIEFVRGRAS